MRTTPIVVASALLLSACGDADGTASDVDTRDGSDTVVTCEDAPFIDLQLAQSGLAVSGSDATVDVTGTVASVGPGTLALTTEDGAVTVTYDFGSWALPVAAGDTVALRWRYHRPFGAAQGLALWAADGSLLALADDGRFGQAWSDGIPDGFTVRDEVAGCAPSPSDCGNVTRMAVRFAHASGGVVVVPPGESALLTTGDGDRFRVVNAYAERLTEVQCLDVVARVAWLMLAEPPTP